MKKYLLAAGFCVAVTATFAQTKKTTATKPAAGKPATTTAALFKNNMDSASYAIGVSIYRSFEKDNLTDINLNLLLKAMTDLKQKKQPVLNDQAIASCLNTLQQRISTERNAEMVKAEEEARKANAPKIAANHKEAQDFLATNGKRQGVVTLPSGLQYEVLKAGTGMQHPTVQSQVTCHYTGTLLNGTKFDSSVDRGQPATFSIGRVIAGWQEALQLMTEGSKWKLWVPADLAYGDSAPGDVIQPGSLLVFEVELIKID